MAGLIYWREISVRDSTNFLSVLFWQVVIWLPWIFFVPILRKTFGRKAFKFNVPGYVVQGIVCLLIIAVHWFWFAGYSSYFSPYLGAPIENYGVFPYFFIFWSLIDLMIIVILAIYFKQVRMETDSRIEFTLQVKRGPKKVLLRTDDIYWISADGYYVNIHSSVGNFLLRRTLKDLSQSLPQTTFIRIHRSAVINRDHLLELKQLPNRRLEVIMRDGDTHPVSRNYIASLKSSIKDRSL